MDFKLHSKYKPMGDQPKAIETLTDGINKNKQHQILFGATGTGKTFTIANVIKNTNKTTLVLSHNKTLAGQLYSELKSMFPENRVEYFISYFDYYRPEAYMPASDTFIDKTSKTNWDIEAMRMSAANALVSDEPTIIVASVASIYGHQNPISYEATFMELVVGKEYNRDDLRMKLVERGYTRNDIDNKPGTFRSKGDVMEITPGHSDEKYYRIDQFGDEIESIKEIDYLTGEIVKVRKSLTIFPAQSYVTDKSILSKAISRIKEDLKQRLKEFKEQGKLLEAQRLEQRINADIESLEEYGFTSGVENYSVYLDDRPENSRPWTILDYVIYNASKRNEKPLLVVDESHMMIPQLNAMYNGDRSRKENLVDYGFRLPSALDNRPLKFKEFEDEFNEFQRIYVSATPANYELDKTGGEVVQQIVRPTGLLDPVVSVVPTKNQIEDIYDRLQKQKEVSERTFILTTTKRMAEELSNYLILKKQKVAYIHSDHKTFERDEILRKLRVGVYDAVIGINLIREGIDIPEVSLILILDADKESFFRSSKALIQIIGRAARNENGRVIMYGDRETESMKFAINETARRRKIQEQYNKENNITPTTIVKDIPEPLNPEKESVLNVFLNDKLSKAEKIKYLSENPEVVKKEIQKTRGKMLKAAREMDFERAAQMRDYILELESIL